MKIAPLYIIGLGPGDNSLLPPAAFDALSDSKVIVGYDLYVNMVPSILRADKEIISTGMRHEQDRCLAAINKARSGLTTSVVCSGDAGIYGMSGLVLELAEQEGILNQMHIDIIPGIPALCGAAALLGAPLMHDFASISLSDLLTPWELIVKRLHAALAADFVVILYNPRSRGRKNHLSQALEIAKQYRPPNTPIGMVRNAHRSEQHVCIKNLGDFDPESADMLSILFIGNASTKQIGKYMVTPRGYKLANKGTK